MSKINNVILTYLIIGVFFSAAHAEVVSGGVARNSFDGKAQNLSANKTQTFYSGDGNVNDGFCFNQGLSSSFSYTEIQSSHTANNVSKPSNTTLLTVGQDLVVQASNENIVDYYVFRASIPFDTSSIPDDAIITGATLFLFGYDADYSYTDFIIEIVQSNQSSSHSLTLSDFGVFAATSGGSLNTGNWNGYNELNSIILNEKGLSWINKKGITNLGLRSSRDINQAEPFQHEFINIWSSESNTSYKPYIVVEYQENYKEENPWPMFRNNIRHTGKCSYRTPSGLPSVKWKCGTNGDKMYSSPSIGSDGTIYIGMIKRTKTTEYFYAINPDGSIKWRYEMDSNVSVYASPAIDSNGNIIIGAYYSYTSYKDKGYIIAFKPNGDLIFNNYIGQTEIKSSPVIDSQGTIYIGTDEGTLHAFYSDGTEKWSKYIGKDIKSSPAIGSDGTIYVGSNDYNLYAFTSEGEYKWRYPTNGYIESSPAISEDDTIYFGSNDGYLYAIKENDYGFSKIWKYDINYKVRSSPAIGSDGTIYISANSTSYPYKGYLYAINKDGRLKWKYEITNVGYSSPTLDKDDNIYIGSANHTFYALNSDGILKWTYTTGNDIRTSPSISPDGTIYFASHDSHLYAIGFAKNEGELYGKVTLWGTNDPISTVVITASNGKTYTFWSNDDGAYRFTIIEGIYDLTISKEGYQSITKSGVNVDPGQFNELNIELNIDGPVNIMNQSLPIPELNIEYSYRVIISGGTYPYSFSIAYGDLPTGLLIHTESGIISGKPTTAGIYTFSIKVTDAQGISAEKEFTIEIFEKLSIITQPLLEHGTTNKEYSLKIEATGGKTPYSFTHIHGDLPPGMSLSNNGNFSGKPSKNGSYDFTVRVTDSKGHTFEKEFHLDIINPIRVLTEKLNNGIVGVYYNNDLSASGGYGKLTWKVHLGMLPEEISLDTSNSVLIGTPIMTSNNIIEFSITDESGNVLYKAYNLEIFNQLQIKTTSLPNSLINEFYSEIIRIEGGVGPFSFVPDGLLPDGLSLDTNKGVISGTPIHAGLSNVSITVTDSTYPIFQTSSKLFSIRTTSLLTILTTSVLPVGVQNKTINPIELKAGGGLSPYEWEVAGNALPEGIHLNSQTGEIYGKPTVFGDFNFNIEIKDSNNKTAQKEFLFQILNPMTIDTIDGDIDGNNSIDLIDAIKCLKILSKKHFEVIYLKADVNNDEQIGYHEVIYILNKISVMR